MKRESIHFNAWICCCKSNHLSSYTIYILLSHLDILSLNQGCNNGPLLSWNEMNPAEQVYSFYETHTKIEAKGLRATTFAIAKLEER